MGSVAATEIAELAQFHLVLLLLLVSGRIVVSVLALAAF